jgi:molybdate transport system substrate-binding protein
LQVSILPMISVVPARASAILSPVKPVRWIALLCLIALPLRAHELRVSSAASLSDALIEIGRAYERQTGTRVVFNFGGSSLLARQIVEGAPCDVFVSADEAKMDALQKQLLIDPATRVSLLSNSLVVVVPSKGGAKLQSLNDLTSPRIETIALAEPGSVPAGIYARLLLERAGLWGAVRKKVIPTDNVRAALAAVEAGNADAAIVYRTDALTTKRVRIALSIAPAQGPRISYPAAVMRDATDAHSARRFLAFLRSPAAQAVFKRYGFIAAPAAKAEPIP